MGPEELSQNELDDCDIPSLRVQLLTKHYKQELVKRLNDLDDANEPELGRALYKETAELFAIYSAVELLEMGVLPDSEEAYWVSSEHLEEIYSFKRLQSRWED